MNEKQQMLLKENSIQMVKWNKEIRKLNLTFNIFSFYP